MGLEFTPPPTALSPITITLNTHPPVGISPSPVRVVSASDAQRLGATTHPTTRFSDIRGHQHWKRISLTRTRSTRPNPQPVRGNRNTVVLVSTTQGNKREL